MRENINANANGNSELQAAIKTMDEIISRFGPYRRNCGVIEPNDKLKAVFPGVLRLLGMQQKSKYDSYMEEFKTLVEEGEVDFSTYKQNIMRCVCHALLSVVGGLSLLHIVDYFVNKNKVNSVADLTQNTKESEDQKSQEEQENEQNPSKTKYIEMIFHCANVPLYLLALALTVISFFTPIAFSLILASISYIFLSVAFQVFCCIKKLKEDNEQTFTFVEEYRRNLIVQSAMVGLSPNLFTQNSQNSIDEQVQQADNDCMTEISDKIKKQNEAVRFATANYKKFLKAYNVYVECRDSEQINVINEQKNKSHEDIKQSPNIIKLSDDNIKSKSKGKGMDKNTP